ncbi:hypothetical protein [Bilophila wadsworthia]|uniref:hypothetical protein n=1 Tax=Bilophila wadsworthia TaxID=35833 RepID=UPI00352262E7
MDTLENYLAEIMKKNKRHIEEDDPICVLHTFLQKFETDLIETLKSQSQASSARLEEQCARLEQAEKQRLERALSFVKSSAETQLGELPKRLNSAINADSFKKALAGYALEHLREHMAISLPQTVWICGGILAALNILLIALLVLHLF